jgi:hypothetical protein
MNLADLTEPTDILVTINGATASKRTRKIVRGHGPRFTFVPNTTRENHILLRRADGTGWNGWLPVREVKTFPAP